MSISSSPTVGTSTRRRFGLAGVAMALTAMGAVNAAPSAFAGRGLPRPTPVVVTAVTSRTISLNVGGSTVKTYDVFANGSRYATATPSSATLPLVITGTAADTVYSITVQENTNGRISPMSVPVTARTLRSIAVGPVTNLRATSISRTEIGIAWTASTTPNVFYEITLNGVSNQATSRTTATLSESINCYPNPCPGTGVKPGQVNVITIYALSVATASSGDRSPVAELSVFVPNV